MWKSTRSLATVDVGSQLKRDPLDGARMGFLTRLFGGDARPTPLQPGDRLVLEGPVGFALPIVGESPYQQALETIFGTRTNEGVERRVREPLQLYASST